MPFKSTTTPAHYYPYPTKRMHDAVRRNAIRQYRSALSSGVLVRKPCERCGRKKGAEGHHEDYARPMDVMWLCRVHHSRRHWELRQEAKKALHAGAAKASAAAERSEPLAIRAYRQLTSNTVVSRGPISDATRQLVRAIADEGLSHNALAARLGVSRQYLSAVFGGGLRTLKSLITVADAVGYDVTITLSKKADAQRVA